MLEVFDNDSIRRILRRRRRDCAPSVVLRRLTCMPKLLVQRGLLWFGHATRRPEGELIKDLLLPLHRTWRRRAGGQLNTWTQSLSGTALRTAEYQVKVFIELAQDRRA